MATSGLAGNGRSKKLRKGKNAIAGKDRISNLPETLLSHILSFLPTDNAVQSSGLSKRWKYVWTSVASLHFQDSWFPSRGKKAKMAKFMNFVDRVLLHYGNSTINHFFLSCRYCYDVSRVNAWISAVIRRKVKKLCIEYLDENLVIPSCLFSCNSLTELNLRMTDSYTLKVPASVFFPSLKILKLCNINFLNGQFSRSTELKFRFPVLEVLDLLGLRWSKAKTVSIEAPLLTTLKLRYFIDENDVWEDDDLLEDIVFHSPSSICDVSFAMGCIGNLNFEHKVGNQLVRLLKQMSCMQILTLSNDTIEILAFAESLDAILPTFDNLINLSLHDYAPVSRKLMDFIRSSPVLESLTFSKGISEWVKDNIVDDNLPSCFQSRLKCVVFKKFFGEEHELDFVHFLLEHATVLEEMNITFVDWNRSGREEVMKQLLAFPRGSRSATIKLS